MPDSTPNAEPVARFQPATDGLIEQLTWAAVEYADHSDGRSNLWALNHTSFMGGRLGPVLRRLADAEARVADLEAERQAVLDVVNIYGDEVLHSALDNIGFAPRQIDGPERA